jgi:peptidoglycan-associated lipoprotein
MKMKKPHILILFLILQVSFFWSCSSKKNLRLANTSYEIGEYSLAIEKFRKSYRKTKGTTMEKAEMAFRMGQTYQAMGEYANASIWYRNAIRRKYPENKAMLYFADCQRAGQEFESAREWYLAYLDSVPGDERALNGLKACEKAVEWINKPSRYVVNIVKELNSKYRDYSPAYVGGKDNELVFTSSQDLATGNRKSSITGEKFADLFISDFEVQKQKWSIPKLLDENIIINTGEEEGAPSFSSNGNQLYFTRCRYDKTEDLGAEIYVSTQSRGEWSEPVKLELTGDSLIAAHPSLSADGQTLYFVSDRPGGFGGKDIWKAEKEGKDFGRPENLGPVINTPGNEAFPYIHRDGTLYFSSDYHTGVGGLDIFKAEKKGETTWVVENMGTPVNSSGDDFGITFADGEEVKGMFSSNRKGSRKDDIYSFYLPPKIFQANGEIFNKETGQRLDGATVRIIGTDGTMLRMRASGGRFQLKLKPETEYVIAAYKESFLNDKVRETTIGLEDSKNFRVELYLTPTDAPIKIENINYEFGKWELLNESKQALDSLVEVLNLNPTITIELMAHTDHIGSETANFELSQKRAQSVVSYLVEKGINPDRLVAKGYGETWPKKVTRELSRQYDFLKRNDELTEQFINTLTPEQQEIARAINRRTEFRVLSNDFHEKFDPEPGE